MREDIEHEEAKNVAHKKLWAKPYLIYFIDAISAC